MEITQTRLPTTTMRSEWSFGSHSARNGVRYLLKSWECTISLSGGRSAWVAHVHDEAVKCARVSVERITRPTWYSPSDGGTSLISRSAGSDGCVSPIALSTPPAAHMCGIMGARGGARV